MRNRLILSTYLLALTALSAWFMWPIYQDAYLLVSVLVGLSVGFGIIWYQSTRKLSPLASTLSVLVAFVVLALPATNPRALSNPQQLLSGWLESLASPVNAWKQLVTVDLPVGTYHALLAPAFLSYLVAGAIFGWVFFGPITRFWAAAYPIIMLVIVAISFGTTTVPGDFGLLGLTLPVATPLASGALILLLLVIYLNWGSSAARRASVINKTESIQASSSGWQRKLRRNLSAVAVVVVVLLGTGFVMQNVGITGTRVVLRTDVDLLKNIQKQTSPLSTYRMYFTNQGLYDSTLLTYSSEQAPDRIRVATMPFYDGDNFTVAPTTQGASSNNFYFARVPSDLPVSGNGKKKSFSVQVGKLDSIWLPLAAGVSKVDFSGTNALKLSDSLFVNRASATGAIIPGTSNNANYMVTYLKQDQPDPTSIKPSSSTIDPKYIPESLTTWLDHQADLPADDGSGIIALANRLRDRGYLSHSFVAPKAAKGTTNWANQLSDYSFFQSNAGHNVARISTMFTELNNREQDARSKAQRDLVATAGDDEQFATAVALIASSKGFPARVVIGFRTNQADELPGSPACSVEKKQGVCKGANLTAWTEIQGNDGKWLSIDATPQFAKKMNLIPVGTAYIPNPTKSGEDKATDLPPAKATPSSDSQCRKHPNSPECNPTENSWQKFWGIFLNYVVPTLETLLVLGIFAAPFMVVVLMKRNRRRGRFEAAEPETQVIGAWEEYVDLLVDNGEKLPGSETRKELSAMYASENLDELAELADLAAFSPRMPTDSEIARAWAIFDAKRQAEHENSKPWKRIKSKLSLRSFLRNVNPQAEFAKLRSSLRFTQGRKVSEGSAVEGLTIEFRRQLKSAFRKKSK